MSEEQNIGKTKRNVLISVDASEHSKRAFNFYVKCLCRPEDSVVVIHAQELMPLIVGTQTGVQTDELRDVMMRADNEAKELLQMFGSVLKTIKEIDFKLIKEYGRPGEVICKNIKEGNIDLVVIGTRGMGKIRRTFLGSVSDYVVHHSHVPICVVPPKK